jgi:cell division septation protein DedD
MTSPAAYRISTTAPVPDLARKTRAALARHGAVMWFGRPSQARQLRRLQAALRADGYPAHYRTDGANLHLLEVGPVGPTRRAVAWWGLSS